MVRNRGIEESRSERRLIWHHIVQADLYVRKVGFPEIEEFLNCMNILICYNPRIKCWKGVWYV